MPPILALSQPPQPAAGHLRGSVVARLAVYPGGPAPPRVRELSAPTATELIEALFAAAAAAAHRLPVLAVREVVENLVHARFTNALVSVLGDGALLRVSDGGPGIPDPDRALQPGFTGAGPAEREVVRGVGCGLPLAAAVMQERGGRLDIEANLGGGSVVTLVLPTPERPPGETAPAGAAGCDEAAVTAASLPEVARMALALLLELEAARPEQLALELGVPLAACGRELVLLEHQGLLARDPDGARRLTKGGSALVETLF